jgi:cell division septation protein DedD
MRPVNKLASTLALLLVGAFALAQSAGSVPPGPSGAAPVQDLATARKTATAALGKADFASVLSGLADGLPPQDAIALISEYAPKVADGPASKALLVRAGQLAVLLGDFSPAADLLESAAFRLAGGRDDALILQSARCRLASGDSAKAADRASLVGKAAASPALALEAGIVSIWASLIDGDGASASTAAAKLLSAAPASSPAARELRFILWVAAPVSERAARAAELAKAFPDSVEASIASSKGGAAAPAGLLPLPHWYLSGLLESAPATSATAAGSPAAASSPAPQPASQPAQPAALPTPAPTTASPPATAASSGADQPSMARYQIGIFSDPRNADLLIAELAKKGFSAKAEKRSVGGRDLVAVIVEGEAESILLRLKDAGYEAYPLF